MVNNTYRTPLSVFTIIILLSACGCLFQYDLNIDTLLDFVLIDRPLVPWQEGHPMCLLKACMNDSKKINQSLSV